jgi:hypothetical protein
MASRSPDRIPIVDWRPKVETVEHMINENWRVKARCAACRLELDVDLFRVGSLRSPDLVLWDRDTGCRGHGCSGRMTFLAKVPGTHVFQPLEGHRSSASRPTSGDASERFPKDVRQAKPT